MSASRDWVALGLGEILHMRGAEVIGPVGRADAVPGALSVRVGEGAPAILPAPVLPTSGELLPGLVQDDPTDVIGARVRLWIAGYLATHARWDGVICAIDGDISHWVHVSADEAVSSQSFLTPRLVQALGGGDHPDMTALADSLSRPERLAAQLRAAEIRGDGAAMTGHLIGAELAAARPYWLGQRVAVIGSGTLPAGYATALDAQGVPAECDTSDPLLPAGLSALGRALGLSTAD